ncbi:beta strand repeat-containing protein [Halarchaeum sp. P4]|uniref:beta strand repeat-containing protein n=1 Tax=Halarchaeum sp. P4 TaxID=3421639 RepID=UPI003EBB03A4
MTVLLVVSSVGVGVGSATVTSPGSTVAQTTTSTQETVNVSYTVQSSYTKVGKVVKLKTKTENGNNPTANWTVTAPNGTVVANATVTTVSWTPQQAGNYSVDFTVPDTNSTDYVEESPPVEVTKQQRYVKLQANTTSVTAPEAVQFTATDSNGAAVNGTLEFANQSVVINHTAVYTFETAGTYNVTLVPDDTATYNYTQDASNADYVKTVTVENGTSSGDSTTTVDLAVKTTDTNGNTQSTFQPDETIEFTVTAAGSGNTVANATVSVAGATLETDSSGVATTTIAETGEYTATVTKENTSSTEYAPANTNVTVAYDRTQLDLTGTDADGNTLTSANPGETISFTVTDANGNTVPNATVSVAGTTLQTGSDAKVSTSISETGEYTAVAAKETTDGVSYVNDTLNFTVARTVVDLSVTVDNGEGSNNGQYQVGNTVRFIVKGDGNPIENATVSVADKTLTTDSQGYATTTFDSAGTYEAVISKEDTQNVTYRNTTTNVSIYYKQDTLKVGVNGPNGNSPPYEPGEAFTFTVTSANNGGAIANATVAIAGKTLTTDANGEATTSIAEVGEYVANVTKEPTDGVKYENTSVNVTIRRHTTQLELLVKDSGGNTKHEFVPGADITFKAKNPGSGSIIENVTVSVAGKTLNTGADGAVTTSISEEGDYTAVASKQNMSGTYYVNDSENVTVARQVTDLAVKVTDAGQNTQTTFRPTQTIRFKVTDDDSGVGISNATVAIAGQRLTTDASGVATTSIDDTGEYTANVFKDETQTTAYTSTSANVTVVREERSLELSLADGTGDTQGPFAPGSTLTFTVTKKSSGNPVANATVAVAGETLETNASGTVARTFDDTGDYTAVATKENASGYTYANDTRNFTISKRMEDVVLSVNETNVRPNEPIKLGADDTDGHDANGIVNFANGTNFTAVNGTEVVTIGEPGVYNLTLVPYDTKTTNYTQGPNSNATVRVAYEHVNLSLSANRSSPVRPNRTVEYRVTDPNSAPIENATVVVANETYPTGADNAANVTFSEEGTYNVTAVKNTTNGYVYYNATTNVTVDRPGAPLNITANESEPRRGENVTFTVTSEGSPLADATVTLPNRTLTTDSDGTVVASFAEEGEVTATATKDGYESDSTSVTVGQDAVVNLTFDGVASVAENDTRTANLTLSYAYEGLAGYDVVVSLPDNETARFAANASYGPQFALGNATVAANNTTVEFDAVDLNGSVQAEASNVTLGTLGLVGVDNGTVNVTVSVQAMESDNETALDVRTRNATFTVRDIPTLVGNETPNDLDNDGTYEDINANGETDYADVIALFSERESDAVQNHTAAFDFTGSGDVGYNDIIELYEMSQAASTAS